MGEYRFAIYFKFHFGATIGLEYGQIVVRLPLLSIHISKNKNASGIYLFGKEL